MTDEVMTAEEQNAAEIAAMDEVWNKAMAEGIEEDSAKPEQSAGSSEDGQPRDERGRFAGKEDEENKEQAESAPEKAEDAQGDEKEVDTAESDKAAVAPPPHLPEAVKAVWGKMPEDAREAVSKSQQDMATRLGEAVRVERAAKPIYDRILQAARENPSLTEMTPDQIAGEVFELSKWAHRLNTDPVGAVMEIAQIRGFAPQLQARLTGQEAAPESGMQQELTALRQELASLKAGIPDVQAQVQAQTSKIELEKSIESFAATKPDWGILEPHIEARIPSVLEQHPHLQPLEALQVAYDSVAQEMLTPYRSRIVDDALRDKKAEAAKAASSINVQPAGAAEAPPLSERDQINAIWDKHWG